MKTIVRIAFCLFAATLATLASAQNVEATHAWARSTVQGQKATGAFMQLKAKDTVRLVAASSAAAGVVEVHEMKMEGNVMTMRAVSGGLELPAGKRVDLTPSGYHLMLMDLKAPLPSGSVTTLTLVFKDAKGVESRMEVNVPVSTTPPTGSAMMDHSQHKT